MRQAGLPLAPEKALPTTTLLHGDCLELVPTLPPSSVHLCFADLPYGVTKNCWDLKISLPAFWQMIGRVCVSGGAKTLTCQQPFTTALIQSNLAEFRYDLVWIKNRYSGVANAKRAPLRSHESVAVFSGQRCFNPQKTYVEKTRTIIRAGSSPRANKNTGLKGRTHTLTNWRNPISTLPFARDDKRDGSGHPTQKPVALVMWLIKTYTNEGDTVLDPTAGSGTTAVAALRTGRHSICIEKDKGYYDVMCNRVAAERERLSSGASSV